MKFRKSALFLAVISSASLQIAWAGEYRAADVEECIRGLYSQADEDRASAGERLSEMGPDAKAAVPRLIEIVQSDPTMSVRGEAAKALGSIGKPAAAAVPSLIAFLKGKEGGLERAYAATALGNIQSQPAQCLAVLTSVIQASDDDPTVRELSARALGDFGGEAAAAVPVLISAIKTGNKGMRDAASSSLAKIPAPASDVPALIEMLSDEITSVRGAAAQSLVGAGAAAAPAVPALVKLLQDSDTSVRMSAVQALGALGKNARLALPQLRLAAKDPFLKGAADDAILAIKTAK